MKISKYNKHITIFITLITFLIVITLLLLHKIKTRKDYIYIYTTLVVQAFFIYAILYNNTIILDITHAIVVLYIIIAPFLDSLFLKLYVLLVLIVIQILWEIIGSCTVPFSFSKGKGILPRWLAKVWTLLLAYSLYHPFT